MPSDDSRTERYQAELNDRLSGSGGCTETWQALSDLRERRNRRDFLTHVGLTLGILSVGGSFTSPVAAREDSSGPDTETTTLRGRKRGQLLRRANRSDDVEQVVETVGEKPDVNAVYAYRVDDVQGAGVTFGDPESRGTTIRYLESASIDGDSTAYGGTPDGNGVRGVETREGSTLSFGTSSVQEAASKIPDDLIDAADVDGSLERDRSVVVQNVGGSERFDLYVPVVRNEEFVDRLVLSSTTPLTDVGSNEFFLAPRGEDGPSIQNHVICGPFGIVCTNYCDILCGTLGGLSGLACLSACYGTIAGIPISPSCGVICGAVVGGTCLATCENLTGH